MLYFLQAKELYGQTSKDRVLCKQQRTPRSNDRLQKILDHSDSATVMHVDDTGTLGLNKSKSDMNSIKENIEIKMNR